MCVVFAVMSMIRPRAILPMVLLPGLLSTICRKIGSAPIAAWARANLRRKNKTVKNLTVRFGLTAFVLFLLVAASSGCAWREAAENIEKSRSLRVGMSKAEVLAVMGEPQRNEEYAKPDLWFYYCQPVWIDGLVTRDECMPLVFQDGKLIGWGNEFYASCELMRSVREKSAE